MTGFFRSLNTFLLLLLFVAMPISAHAFWDNAGEEGALFQGNTYLQVESAKPVPRDHGPSSVEIVPYASSERPGSIVISNSDRYLFRILEGGKAERYKISVGRDGFTWTGTAYVGAKKEWPAWRPPSAMRQRQPSLPTYVPPGPYNPLGARALYLFQNGADTLFRIHGTNDSESLGGFQTSGCFRLSNADVMRLYKLVGNGTKVVVK
ncbi:L,D-transpeptidase [Aliiroseovarius subalbicans]|uniref:L,D-transpeptidase n=1 Tax=Aliiroseovarius subalbicans TaxID=2925840 RepID=UPI001F55B7F2|nr:L,D-transpeptidase [Aliiroseovarius subalbicans]MCI2400422.1 L,D-transpeptidase [Aliiroseovarius subalbicans]